MQGSIVRSFLDSCQRAPGKACLIFEGQCISYAHVSDLVHRWAAGLHSWGLQRGDRVALFLENSPDFLAAYLGTHLAGGIVVLVNTQYRQVELRHILADSGARLCVTDAARLSELEQVAADLPQLEAVVLVEAKDEGRRTNTSLRPSSFVLRPFDSFLADAGPFIPDLPDPESIAVLGYTSGTTGQAKGAMLRHRNLLANSRAVTQAWRWTADDVLLLTLPLFHVHGLAVGMHGTFVTGGAADLRRRFDAADVYDTLLRGTSGHTTDGEIGVTMFFGVPTMYTRLVAEAQRRAADVPPPIRLYVSGSAPLSVQTFEDFECRFGQRILERYGMTETIMNLTNPYDGERRPGTVGGPFPGQEARIVDVRTRQPVQDQSVGEIQVRGPHVFQGYWQRPDATAEAFDAEGWFNTGDLGWCSADGYYTITGRAKELIITGGYNVYPREVEEVLATHPGVAEAAVLGLPDPEFGEQIVAAIVRHPGPCGDAVTAD
ncbi:MAG TPA: AMP-binding protein, partial [Chloroflexota bacterium]|nr:AMP-binding protein [Chloroflexota bacterium]